MLKYVQAGRAARVVKDLVFFCCASCDRGFGECGSVEACDIDLRRDLFSNIVLSGGTTFCKIRILETTILTNSSCNSCVMEPEICFAHEVLKETPCSLELLNDWNLS